MANEEKFYLTPKGLEKVKKEYDTLKMIKKIRVNGESFGAFDMENLSSEFASLGEDMDLLNTKLAELEDILNNVKLIKISSIKDKNIVNLGATVEMEAGSHRNRFTLVGTLEADPMAGKISDKSPIGQAILGHKIGDNVVIPFPNKKIYKIRKIKYDEI